MKLSFSRDVNGHVATQVYTVEQPVIPVYAGGDDDKALFIGLFTNMDTLIDFIKNNGGQNITILTGDDDGSSD